MIENLGKFRLVTLFQDAAIFLCSCVHVHVHVSFRCVFDLSTFVVLFVFCILYFVFCILYLCILYFVFCILYFVIL